MEVTIGKNAVWIQLCRYMSGTLLYINAWTFLRRQFGKQLEFCVFDFQVLTISFLNYLAEAYHFLKVIFGSFGPREDHMVIESCMLFWIVIEELECGTPLLSWSDYGKVRY